MRWEFDRLPVLSSFNLGIKFVYDWYAFVMPNHDIGLTVVNPDHPETWVGLSALTAGAAQRDVDEIHRLLCGDSRLKSHDPIRFYEDSCRFGGFIRVGLDTDRQAAMFKLCFMGAPFSAVLPE